MTLISHVILQPYEGCKAVLLQTMIICNRACDFISDYAWRKMIFGQYRLQGLIHRDVENKFGLAAQMVIRSVARVSRTYGLDRTTKHSFEPCSAIAYDDRLLSWFPAKDVVSIWTIDGRRKVPYLCGERQKQLLKTRQGETDLILYGGEYLLSTMCIVEDPDLFIPDFGRHTENENGVDDPDDLRKRARVLGKRRTTGSGKRSRL